MSTSSAAALERIRSEAEAVLLEVAPEAPPLASGRLARGAELRPEAAVPSTVVPLLGECRGLACAATERLVEAVVDAAAQLTWRQTYSAADGFRDEDLALYGWFQVSSPAGPYVVEDHRLAIGYWGRGFYYPRHWHTPAEVYVVLAGNAVFHSDGRAPRRCEAGDTVWHASGQIHAAEMTPGPLLAMALWWGEDLMAKSTLVEDEAWR